MQRWWEWDEDEKTVTAWMEAVKEGRRDVSLLPGEVLRRAIEKRWRRYERKVPWPGSLLPEEEAVERLLQSLRPLQRTALLRLREEVKRSVLLWPLPASPGGRQRGTGQLILWRQGYGKTRLALALAALFPLWAKEGGQEEACPTLLLAPLRTLLTWQEEWREWARTYAPWLPAPTVLRTGKRAEAEEALERAWQGAPLAIPYHLLPRVADLPPIYYTDFGLLIADEVQALQNPRSARTKAAWKLSSAFRVGLSATPFTHDIGNLPYILAFLARGTVQDHREGILRYVYAGAWYPSPRYGQGLPMRRPKPGLGPEGTLAGYLSFHPYIHLADPSTTPLAPPLPDLEVEVVDCPVSPTQEGVLMALRLAGGVVWVEGGTPLFLRFRPEPTTLLVTLLASTDLAALWETVQRARKRLPQRAFRRHDVEHALRVLGLPFWDPRATPPEEASGKRRPFLERARDLMDSGKKVLVFTRYRTTAQNLARDPALAPYHPRLLTGGMSQERMARAIADFTTEGRVRMLVSTPVAREGLNLQAAQAVLFYGPFSWSAADMLQALRRVHRPGSPHETITAIAFLSLSVPEEEHLTLRVGDKHEDFLRATSFAPFDDAFPLLHPRG